MINEKTHKNTDLYICFSWSLNHAIFLTFLILQFLQLISNLFILIDL